MGFIYGFILKTYWSFLLFLCFWFMSVFSFSWSGVGFSLGVESVYMVFLVLLIISLSMLCLSQMNVILKLLLVFSLLFFTSKSIFGFYVSLEGSIIPIVLMLLFWGAQPEKVSAMYYFLLYTVMSGFPLLVLFSFYFSSFEVVFMKEMSTLMMLFLLFSFVVKLPLFGLHLWLPKAHTEAPSLGSIVLAGLLLKLGGYGVNVVLFSLTSFYSFCFLLFAFFGSLCSAFVSSLQSDSKVYVAFSSVTHMNLTFFVLILMIGMSKNISFLMMIAHGITASLMFWLMGMSYYASLSRSLYFNKGWFLSFIVLMLMIFFSNFSMPPMIVFFQEAIFVSVVYKLSYLMLFFLFLYIVVVMYYNIFLGVTFLMKKDKTDNLVMNSVCLFVFSGFMFNFWCLQFIFY